MFAKYKENIYILSSNSRKKEIITRIQEKADDDFTKDGSIFFKSISEDDLSDIFSVDIWINYDANLPNTPNKWSVDLSDSELDNNIILLRFTEGLLLGWEVEDKNVCTKRIHFAEITGAGITYKYSKKHFIDYDNPVIEEFSIPLNELIEYINMYRTNNI